MSSLQAVQESAVRPTCQQLQTWAAQTLHKEADLLGGLSGTAGNIRRAAGGSAGSAPALPIALQGKTIPMMLLSMCGISGTEYVCEQIVQELKAKVGYWGSSA